MKNAPANTESQQKRVDELTELLGIQRELTPKQYLDALKEIQANYTTALRIRSVSGDSRDSGAMINVIDKTHWLVESIEKKQGGTPTDDLHVNVYFKSAPKPASEE